MSAAPSTKNLGGLVLGAIGVVFGDIGTSPTVHFRSREIIIPSLQPGMAL